MPAELKAKLEAAAVENRRSITAELVARIEASFGDDQQADLLAERIARKLMELQKAPEK